MNNPNENVTASDEIHLLDLLVILARHKKLLIGTPIVTGALAMAISMLLPPVFTSTVKIMPPQQQQSSNVAAMLGQLGGLAGAAGGMAGMKSPADLYVGLLESRTVADNLIARFKLQERYDANMAGTRKALSSHSEIATGKKDGMITVSVRDESPQFAANLANAYVEELMKLNQSMALTEASQRRLFFEKQMAEAKDQLANAEVALRTTQEKTGMIQPDAQVQAIIANAAQLKGTIAAKEVELNAMRTFAAGSNPELLRAQEELRGLQRQLARLESNSKDGDFMVATGKIPAAGVSYVRSMRDVKYYETIFEVLARQFEMAKIDEAKDSSVIQVLDKAIPAEQKTSPKRALMSIAGVVGGFILGIILAFVHEGYCRARDNPGNTTRWQQLATAWRKKPFRQPA